MKRNNDNRKVEKPKDAINDFPGVEIESKIQVVESYSKSFLSVIKSIIIGKNDFLPVHGLGDFEWIFNFDYYVEKRENGNLEQCFILIHHPSIPKFWVRKKKILDKMEVDTAFGKTWIIAREENTRLVKNCPSTEMIERVIKKEGSYFEGNAFLYGRLIREKYYTFLKSYKSGMTYSLSFDICRFSNKKMSQIELEYKWSDKGYNHKDDEKINFIIRDTLTAFNNLSTLNTRSEKLKTTDLTKFEWMIKNSERI